MEFIPVTQGSEFWDKVLDYEKTLNFVSSNEGELADWVGKREVEVEDEIKDIIVFLDTPEGKKYISDLNKEDGR